MMRANRARRAPAPAAGDCLDNRALMLKPPDNPPPAPPAHLDAFDGWRGLAILLLLAGHFVPVPGINLGALGVNFFFVLSGWLMTRLLFVQLTPVDLFYRRRISRIVPAHICFVALVTLGLLAASRPFEMTEVLDAAFFVNNYLGTDPAHALPPLGHIWSLSVEEHSYVLLSLVALASRARRINPVAVLGALALACAACAVTYSLLFNDPQRLYGLWLHTEVAGYGIFVSGMLMLVFSRHPPPRAPVALVLALLLAGFALHWWSVPLAVQKILGVGALALAVNLLPFVGGRLPVLLAWAPLRLLGLWSFSLYLWQQPFYLWSRSGAMSTGAGLACAFAAGLASYYLLERPARELLNRRWRGPATVAAAG